MNKKKKRIFLLGGVLLFLGLILAFLTLKKNLSSDKKSEIKSKTIATTELDHSFLFPADNEAGEEIDEVALTLTSAEKTKEIAVKGQPIEAQKKKTFLVLNFKIENRDNEPLFIYPSNFVRLVGEDGDKFAPDFHNGVAQIEPVSVKRDQMGFIIPEEENAFSIFVGEIDQEKKEIKINF